MKHIARTDIMEFMKRIVCTVVGAIVGGITGILVGAVAGATDRSNLDRTIQSLELARDIIRGE